MVTTLDASAEACLEEGCSVDALMELDQKLAKDEATGQLVGGLLGCATQSSQLISVLTDRPYGHM